jgi:hypothetical protein
MYEEGASVHIICLWLGRLFWFVGLLLSAFASEMGHRKPQRDPKGVTVSPKSAQMVPKVGTGLFSLPFAPGLGGQTYTFLLKFWAPGRKH